MPRSATLPTAQEQEAIRAFWRLYEPHQAAVSARLAEAAARDPDFAPIVKGTSPDEQTAQNALNREALQRAVVDGDWVGYIAHVRRLGAVYAYADVSFAAWFELTTAFRDEIVALLEKETRTTAELSQVLRGLNRYVDLALAALGEAYLDAKQAIIAQQQSAIRELSTPVLQLRERLLILPVVGLVDSDRARQVTEAMLQAIRDKRARVVVMDITGVPIVDSKVANHLVQTVEAARLMGAHVIVTGISPEIAQTMVTIGADLGHVQTLGDLQSGFDEATARLGLKVVRVGEDAP